MKPDKIIGIWHYNVDDNRLHWDRNMCKIFNHPSEEAWAVVSYEDFTGLVHPDDLEYVKEQVAMTLSGETESYFANYRVHVGDGRADKFVDAWGSVMNIMGKKCLVGACHEVSKRQKIVQQITELKNNG